LVIQVSSLVRGLLFDKQLLGTIFILDKYFAACRMTIQTRGLNLAIEIHMAVKESFAQNNIRKTS
jgi:hypothetical protein